MKNAVGRTLSILLLAAILSVPLARCSLNKNDKDTSDDLLNQDVSSLPDNESASRDVAYAGSDQKIEDLISNGTLEFTPYEGALVYFGTYGGEQIEWMVIDKNDNNEIFLVSSHVLDAKPYDETRTVVTWEDCTLRQWLNNEFYNEAFNSEEQKSIITTTVDNTDYVNKEMELRDAYSGPDTQDKVFVLSDYETRTLLQKHFDFRCEATQFAKNNGAWVLTKEETYGHEGSTDWWVRTNGGQNEKDYWGPSTTDGVVLVNVTDRLTVSSIGVRPALWVKADAVKPTESAAYHLADTINYGYYQGEPIQWSIIDYNTDGEILLFSKYAIEVLPYDENAANCGEGVLWENCSLRKWLNEEFYDSAFTKDEQDEILNVTVENAKYVSPDAPSFEFFDQEECIFLLTYSEADRYLPNGHHGFLNCTGTQYALQKGLEVKEVLELDDYCDYWYRNPGYGNKPEASSRFSDYYGESVDSTNIGVRPAMWVDCSVIYGISVRSQTEKDRPSVETTGSESVQTQTTTDVIIDSSQNLTEEKIKEVLEENDYKFVADELYTIYEYRLVTYLKITYESTIDYTVYPDEQTAIYNFRTTALGYPDAKISADENILYDIGSSYESFLRIENYLFHFKGNSFDEINGIYEELGVSGNTIVAEPFATSSDSNGSSTAWDYVPTDGVGTKA